MSIHSSALQNTAPLGLAGRSKFFAWIPRAVLVFTMLFTGISSLVQEYVIGTVFAYLLGNSIEQITVTIGVMMLGMGVGTFMQKFIQSSLAEWFLGIEIVLVFVTGFAPVFLQWAYVELPDDFVWIKFLYMFTPGVLIGMEIPLIMKINERFTRNLGNNISQTWAWDYVGGAIGVVIWIILLRSIDLTHISILIAGCNLAVALVLLGFFWSYGMFERKSSGPLWSVVAFITIIVMTAGYLAVGSWTQSLTQRLYDDPIIASATTKYQNIVLTQGVHPSDPTSHDYTLWLNGNKQFSSADEAIYHEYLVHPAMNLAAKRDRVLILGGGDGLALREVLKYPDVKEVNLVDLDPGMIELARDNPVMSQLNDGSFNDARVTSNLDEASWSAGIQDSGEKTDVLLDTGEDSSGCSDPAVVLSNDDCIKTPTLQDVADVSVFTVDADLFLSNQAGQWDVVIIDLPDPNSIELAKLYSLEFYSKVQQVLAPDGIVVVQSTSPYHAKETFLSIQRTMVAAGLATTPYHDNVPSFGDWGWILGSKTMSPDALYDRANQLEDFQVETREVEAANMQRALIFNRGWLQSSNTEISTLMRPVVFDYYTYEAWRVD